MLVADKLLLVCDNKADVSVAGEVRESRWRDRRERPSHVLQADFVVEFMVDRAEVKAAIRDWDSERGMEALPAPMPPVLGRADCIRVAMFYVLVA